jgi:hypothetical protein
MSGQSIFQKSIFQKDELIFLHFLILTQTKHLSKKRKKKRVRKYSYPQLLFSRYFKKMKVAFLFLKSWVRKKEKKINKFTSFFSSNLSFPGKS